MLHGDGGRLRLFLGVVVPRDDGVELVVHPGGPEDGPRVVAPAAGEDADLVAPRLQEAERLDGPRERFGKGGVLHLDLRRPRADPLVEAGYPVAHAMLGEPPPAVVEGELVPSLGQFAYRYAEALELVEDDPLELGIVHEGVHECAVHVEADGPYAVSESHGTGMWSPFINRTGTGVDWE